MRHLREKLHSDSGASILLALLLFLVCCMVAASVLAAAASNTGKIRSNQAEQQKYLTLSSAIQLVAVELQQATYTWKYTVYEWETTTGGGSTEHYFYCEQNEGTYTCGDLGDQLPLQVYLEGELKNQFPKDGGVIRNGYKTLDDSHAKWEEVTTRDLLVTLPNDLDGYPYQDPSAPMEVYQLPREVSVRVVLNHNTHHITLTAWLGTDVNPPADKSDTMIAELVAEVGTAPLLDYTPTGKTAGPTDPPAGALSDEKSGTMIWKLNWIKKGGL